MDRAIRHHFNSEIIERKKLTGGYTFQTWLLTLTNNTKVVFRARSDFETGSGRKIIIANILEREKFFYENVNKSIGHICPEVYLVDGSHEYYEDSYCIMEYIEGTPLDKCFNDFDEKTKNDVSYQIGEIAAQINCINIDSKHPYVASRDS